MKRPDTKVSHVIFLILVLAVTGCANFSAIDKPISQVTPEFNKQIDGGRSSELLVLVGFSGGGTRAAALAYGVLKTLADTEVTTEKGRRSLLHEVDVISSVSGGSFTSAYYGLRGDKIFEEFEDRFLRKNVEGALIRQVLSPVNWIPQMSSIYGRGDVAAEYYDKHIFNGATFADLKRPGAPVVVINATDLATGMRFAFAPAYFDLICADLNQYPLSRAVTASSAVPVLFTPITVKSYAGTCGFELPAWLAEAEKDERGSTRKAEARGLMEYMDHEKRPWIHLVDGGIADNLGLRAVLYHAEPRRRPPAGVSRSRAPRRASCTDHLGQFICAQEGEMDIRAGGPGTRGDDRQHQFGSDRPIQLRYPRYRALLFRSLDQTGLNPAAPGQLRFCRGELQPGPRRRPTSGAQQHRHELRPR